MNDGSSLDVYGMLRSVLHDTSGAVNKGSRYSQTAIPRLSAGDGACPFPTG